MDKLNKESKLMKLEALREKKRRLKKQRPQYVPNEGQIGVHNCTKRNRFVFAGNGSGKSCLAVNEVIWAAQGFNPVLNEYTFVPARIAVVLDLPSKVGDVWIPELSKWIEIEEGMFSKEGKPYVSKIRFKNGSVIQFLFHEQGLLAAESIEVDFVVYDEPPSKELFIALQRGGRTKGRQAKFLLIGTPLAQTWLRTDVYLPWMKGELDNAECFRFSTKVNENNLQDGYINNFSKFLSEKEKRTRLEGEFFDSDSLALAHLFNKKTHVINAEYFFKYIWKKDYPVVVAIDPHINKPHTAVLLGADKDNNLYLIKEFKSKTVARDFAKELHKLMAGYNIIDIIVDSLGSADLSGGEGFKSFIQVLNECGIRCRPTTYEEKSDEAFIDRIKNVLIIPEKPNNFGLFIPKLRIVEGNPTIVKEIENASWHIDKRTKESKPKIDISNLDMVSCLKYALSTGHHFKRGKERPISYTAKGAYGLL